MNNVQKFNAPVLLNSKGGGAKTIQNSTRKCGAGVIVNDVSPVRPILSKGGLRRTDNMGGDSHG